MPDSPLDFRLLGTCLLLRDGEPLAGQESQRHPLALLAMLATAPDGTLSRGKLAGLFWSEASESRARNRLSTHVHRIRRSLGEDVVESVGDDLRLNVDVLACDVHRFEEAIAAGELSTAVGLYEGPFLDGFRLRDAPAFEKRTERVRRRLRTDFRDALEALAEQAEERGEPDRAAHWWRKRANEDPYDGRVIHQLMRCLADAGNPAAAVRAARVHGRMMQAELGLEAVEEVRELAARLREASPGDGERASGPAEGPTTEEAEPPSSPAGVDEPEPGAARQTGPPPAADRWPRSRRAALVVAFLLLGAAATAGWQFATTGESRALDAPAQSVAVLPFQVVGGEDGAGIGEGLHADLVTRLALVSGLRVISSTSVQRYRELEEDLSSIARELGVRWVLEGSVQRSADEIQVNAQLIDARTDEHVWAERYRRSVTARDLFDLQAELTRRIAAALEVNLSQEEEENLQRRSTEDVDAYEAFLRGRSYQERTGGVPELREAHRTALQLFERAVGRDSGFAAAWAAKSASHLTLYELSGGTAESEIADARSAAARALRADPGGPSGPLAQAEIDRRADRDFESALRQYGASDPKLPKVLQGKAKVLQARGRLEEAIDLYERARTIDPMNHHVIFQSWWAYGLLRRYDEAEAVLDRVLELAPDHGGAQLHRAMLPFYRTGDASAVGPAARDLWEVRWRLGDLSEPVEPGWRAAMAAFEPRHQIERATVLAARGDSGAARDALDSARVTLEERVMRDSAAEDLSWLGYALAGLGQREAALTAAHRAVEIAGREEDVLILAAKRHALAVTQTLVGELEAAIATLETYLSEPGLRSFACVATHPVLSHLRDHPRFRELERRYGG